MKKQSLRIAAALAITVVVGGTCLARPRVLTARIPFTFEVGKVKLPAGQYEIETVTTGSGTLQTIRLLNSTLVNYFYTNAVETYDRNSKPELVFHRYGNEYFLTQIRNGDGTGRQLIESSQEKEVARERSAIEVAIAVR